MGTGQLRIDFTSIFKEFTKLLKISDKRNSIVINSYYADA